MGKCKRHGAVDGKACSRCVARHGKKNLLPVGKGEPQIGGQATEGHIAERQPQITRPVGCADGEPVRTKGDDEIPALGGNNAGERNG